MNCLTVCEALAHQGIEHYGHTSSFTHEHLGHMIIFGAGFVFLIGYLIHDIYRKRQK